MLTAALIIAIAQLGKGSAKDLAADVGRFQVTNTITVTVPEGAKDLAIWFPIPREDPEQEITELKVEAPAGWRETKDALGNRNIHLRLAAPSGKVAVATHFVVKRREVNADIDAQKSRPLDEAEKAKFASELRSDANVVVDDEVRALAAKIRGDEKNPVRVARKLYDWTLANIE